MAANLSFADLWIFDTVTPAVFDKFMTPQQQSPVVYPGASAAKRVILSAGDDLFLQGFA